MRTKRRPRSTSSAAAPKKHPEPKTLAEARAIIEGLRYVLKEQAGRIAILEKRIDLGERERRELYLRIQRWEPPPADDPEPKKRRGAKGPPSHTGEGHEAVESDAEECAKLGLHPNSAGGVVHIKTGILYESIADFKETMAYMVERGYDVSKVDPRFVV